MASEAIEIEVALCIAPRVVRAWRMLVPCGTTLAQAQQLVLAHYRANEPDRQESSAEQPGALDAWQWGVWGRILHGEQCLQQGDRIEAYRSLNVDPKVARRQRFAQQGARGAGLFANRRKNSKPGY